jgi:hypothetical protein
MITEQNLADQSRAELAQLVQQQAAYYEQQVASYEQQLANYLAEIESLRYQKACCCRSATAVPKRV